VIVQVGATETYRLPLERPHVVVPWHWNVAESFVAWSGVVEHVAVIDGQTLPKRSLTRMARG
jgi:hypothetical protein